VDEGSAPRYVSVLDLFSIGIGPSSSHTVGPMRAATRFAEALRDAGVLVRVDRVAVDLYGSLGATGIGHGTPDAVVAGLRGLDPATCDPDEVRGAWTALGSGSAVALLGTHHVSLAKDDVRLAPLTRKPEHSNTLRLRAWDGAGALLREQQFFSVGGGFVTDGPGVGPDGVAFAGGAAAAPAPAVPHPFGSAADLLALCATEGTDIAGIARRNEVALHGEDALDAGIAAIWRVMRQCVADGLRGEGVLPGGLGVKRRAAGLRGRLELVADRDTSTEWLQAYAMAVNEENAAGRRVVTAPTNGAAGIVPAVLHHHVRTTPGGEKDVPDFLLTATAVGTLFATNASISGAEAGCQGEVGSAAAMAAAGLCAVRGGIPEQVENAAEIAMEHHLGLTCDPVGGLVQVPCIERNAIASATAVAAALMALHGDGTHVVSLDVVIETMRQTGLDMSSRYKETSTGGLAVNVPECGDQGHE
jgi:L-serine dehydratase